MSKRKGQREIALYGSATLVYIAIGVAVPDFLFSMPVAVLYLLAAVWLVPALLGRWR